MFSPFRPEAKKLPLDEESEIIQVAVGTDQKTVGVMLEAPPPASPRRQMWRVRSILRDQSSGDFELVVDSQLMIWKRIPVGQEHLETVMGASALLREGIEDVIGGEG